MSGNGWYFSDYKGNLCHSRLLYCHSQVAGERNKQVNECVCVCVCVCVHIPFCLNNLTNFILKYISNRLSCEGFSPLKQFTYILASLWGPTKILEVSTTLLVQMWFKLVHRKATEQSPFALKGPAKEYKWTLSLDYFSNFFENNSDKFLVFSFSEITLFKICNTANN